jgi:predicted acylesterase/phospholipase RssA
MVRGVAFGAAGFDGFTMLGALQALQQSGTLSETTRLIGTSAGSVVAAVGALEINADSCCAKVIAKEHDIRSLVHVSLIRLFENLNLCDGDRLFAMIENVLNCGWEAGEAQTFASLYKRQGKVLVIFGTCLKDGREMRFDHIHTPHVPIMDAIRLSCAIPFIFPYRVHENSVCIDGAFVRNYPIDELNDLTPDQKIGVCLGSVIPGKKLDMFAYISQLCRLVCRSGTHNDSFTLTLRSDHRYLLPTPRESRKMFESGREQMTTFIDAKTKAKVD